MSLEEKLGEATLTLIKQVSSLATTSEHHGAAIDKLTNATTQLVETTQGHAVVAAAAQRRADSAHQSAGDAHEKLDNLLGIPRKALYLVITTAVVTVVGLVVNGLWGG
jgi:hypothetical protein